MLRGPYTVTNDINLRAILISQRPLLLADHHRRERHYQTATACTNEQVGHDYNMIDADLTCNEENVDHFIIHIREQSLIMSREKGIASPFECAQATYVRQRLHTLRLEPGLCREQSL